MAIWKILLPTGIWNLIDDLNSLGHPEHGLCYGSYPKEKSRNTFGGKTPSPEPSITVVYRRPQGSMGGPVQDCLWTSLVFPIFLGDFLILDFPHQS